MMLELRESLINIFNMIDEREKILKELNYIVVQGDKGGRRDVNAEKAAQRKGDFTEFQAANYELDRVEREVRIKLKVKQLEDCTKTTLSKI